MSEPDQATTADDVDVDAMAGEPPAGEALSAEEFSAIEDAVAAEQGTTDPLEVS